MTTTQIRPGEAAFQTAAANPRRWQILAVLCISLFVDGLKAARTRMTGS